jgi:regulator of replication initiation timing
MCLVFIGLLGGIPPLSAQNRPNDGQVVRQRILTDLDSIKDQLNALNQTVNRLRKQVGRLQNKNQKRKNEIRNLKQRLDDLEPSAGEKNTAEQSTSPGEPDTKNEDSMWMSRPNLDYEVRREPLDREVMYVTTDDTVLTELAHSYYQDASYWRQIYRVNKDKLPSPNVVPPKIKLRLPPIDELQTP